MNSEPKKSEQSLLRVLLQIYGIAALLMIPPFLWWRPWSRYDLPSGMDVFAAARGTWDWANSEVFCQSSGHTIHFSDERDIMVIRTLDPATDNGVRLYSTYDIHGSTPRTVRGQIREEQRLTDSGEPVVWDLVVESKDQYRWHRTDWPSGSRTDPIRRCPAEAAIHHVAASAPLYDAVFRHIYVTDGTIHLGEVFSRSDLADRIDPSTFQLRSGSFGGGGTRQIRVVVDSAQIVRSIRFHYDGSESLEEKLRFYRQSLGEPAETPVDGSGKFTWEDADTRFELYWYPGSPEGFWSQLLDLRE